MNSVLKKYPSKFVGCCLANPTEDEKGVKEFENLILKVLIPKQYGTIVYWFSGKIDLSDTEIPTYARMVTALYVSIHICGLLVNRCHIFWTVPKGFVWLKWLHVFCVTWVSQKKKHQSSENDISYWRKWSLEVENRTKMVDHLKMLNTVLLKPLEI